MNEREQTVRLWFDMWLQAEDRGITSIFAPDCIYTESWGPEYHSAAQVKHWFEEWNTRGRVLVWDILRFFHTGQLKENIRHCRRCILIPDTLISSACHHNLTAEGFHLRPQQKRAEGLRSGGFPENGDPGDIPSEGFNIFPDPSQRGQLIQRTVITCMPVPFPQGFSQIQVSKHTQPVIY